MKSAGTDVAALNVNATWVPAGCKQQSVCQEVFPICDSASMAADVVLPAGGNRGFFGGLGGISGPLLHFKPSNCKVQ
mgnify:CR=1 FL=1